MSIFNQALGMNVVDNPLVQSPFVSGYNGFMPLNPPFSGFFALLDDGTHFLLLDDGSDLLLLD